MKTFACGLDFGTSNSTIGFSQDGRIRLAPLEAGRETLPTALFYGESTRPQSYGRAAIADYLAGEPGRLMRSIKSVLGTGLMEEATQVGGGKLRFQTVIGQFIREMKGRAEALLGGEIDTVVQGRPVRFVDDDEAADKKAEAALEAILKESGFCNVVFQYESVAAARHWEAHATGEELALVADIGGGTSDFSLVRLHPGRAAGTDRSGDILGNYGIRLGGADFDCQLSLSRVMPEFGFGRPLGQGKLDSPNWIYCALAAWPQINTLYAPRNRRDIQWVVEQASDPVFRRLETIVGEHLGHRVAQDVEQAKIGVSATGAAVLALDYVEPGLRLPVTAQALGEALETSLGRLSQAVEECLKRAGVRPDAVGALVLTGGSTEMPGVRKALTAPVPGARLVSCDTFGAVGLGLAQEAALLA